MHEESDSLHPYETFVDTHWNCWFLTKEGIVYNAGFSDSLGYFCQHPQFDKHLVTFAFANYLDLNAGNNSVNHSHPNTVTDCKLRIRDTIIWLIIEFLNQFPQKSIIIVCHSADNLEACRHRLFDRWFRQATQLIPHSISKHDSNFGGEGFGSIFVHNDNPDRELIRQAFLSIGSSPSDK